MMLLSLLAIAASGAGLVALAMPEAVADRVDRLLRASLAAALGLGAWSAAYALTRMLGSGAAAKDIVLVALGSSLLFVARRHRRAAVPSADDPAPRWLWVLFAVALAIAAGAFFEHNRRFPDGGYDAWMIWNLRARFLAGAADLRTVFSPAFSFRAHADYPWLLPGLVAQGIGFGPERSVSQAIAGAFGALAATVVPLGLARLHGTRSGVLAALAIVSVPAFTILVTHQQSDIPLAAYVGCSAVLIGLAHARPGLPAGLLALAGFAAGLGAWTKNEGTLYAACLAAGLLWRTRNLRATLAFAAGASPCFLLLLVFKFAFAPPNDLLHFSSAATALAHVIDARRWATLALALARRILYFQLFALWMIAQAAFLIAWRGRPPGTPIGVALCLAALGLVLIYIVQPYPLDFLVPASIDRLIMQLWPAAVFANLSSLARAMHGAPD